MGANFAVQKGSEKSKLNLFDKIAIFKGFGEGLGRVLGGFGDDFGRVLARSGSLLGTPGPFQRRFGPVRLRVGGFEPLGVSKTII